VVSVVWVIVRFLSVGPPLSVLANAGPSARKERRTGLRFARESVCRGGESGDGRYVKDSKMQGDGWERRENNRKIRRSGRREGMNLAAFVAVCVGGLIGVGGVLGGCAAAKAPPNVPPPEYEETTPFGVGAPPLVGACDGGARGPC
jgi:hypothetical protein